MYISVCMAASTVFLDDPDAGLICSAVVFLTGSLSFCVMDGV